MLINFGNVDDCTFLICLDCEFTCWENSEALDWPDPDFPPEIIQIGLSVYDILTFTVLDEFSSYVSPKVNTALSEYCKDLLDINQENIDNAKLFSQIADSINVFLNPYTPPKSLVCSFGPDCERIAADSRRQSFTDPLARYNKLDLRLEAARILGYGNQSIYREFIYKDLDLPPCVGRHDALSDARDLVRIVQALRNYQESCQTDPRNKAGYR